MVKCAGMRRAVFFDKDGVINKMVDRGSGFMLAGKEVRLTAPWTLDELVIFEPARRLVTAVKEQGYLAIVITNQPDVSYGVMKPENLELILQSVRSLGFDDLFACFHGRDDNCRCRKPWPGMLLQAAAKWGIALERSFMLGDMDTDAGAARAAGCRSVIIHRHYNHDVRCDVRITSYEELLTLLP